MKILLLEPPLFRLIGEKRIYAPVGLLYLASTLEMCGHDVIVYNSDSDYSINNEKVLSYYDKYFSAGNIIKKTLLKSKIYKEIADLIVIEKPQVVGISVKSESVPIVIELINLIKKNNYETKIILGGPHFDIDHECHYFNQADLIVKGESELKICDAVDTLFNNREMLSEVCQIDLNSLPLLTLKYLPVFQMKNISNQNKQLISTARGCPFRCSFCYKSIFPKSVRFLSGENIFLNMEKLYTSYNIKKFYIVDDTFGVNFSQLSSLVNNIVKSNLPFSWSCMCHSSILTEEKIELMHRGGCKSIHLGVESGSNKLLKLLGKKTTTQQIYNVSKILHKYNIKLHAFMMVGLPDETMKDINQSVDLVKTIKPSEIAAQVYQPYPNTILFDKLNGQGLNVKINWPNFTRLSLHKHKFRGNDSIEVEKRIKIFLKFADEWNSNALI
jgi:radical SAM superfamily enzyme YgiQ (UPF0313 family)